MELQSEPLIKHDMDCQICMEPFNGNIYKIKCGSSVDHLICVACEEQWRSQMPVHLGRQVMTCPTCRQPEIRDELDEAIVVAGEAQRIWGEFLRGFFLVLPNPIDHESFRRPQECRSGRACQSTSRASIRRRKTKLRCVVCNVTPCCYRCRSCQHCVPRT